MGPPTFATSLMRKARVRRKKGSGQRRTGRALPPSWALAARSAQFTPQDKPTGSFCCVRAWGPDSGLSLGSPGSRAWPGSKPGTPPTPQPTLAVVMIACDRSHTEDTGVTNPGPDATAQLRTKRPAAVTEKTSVSSTSPLPTPLASTRDLPLVSFPETGLLPTLCSDQLDLCPAAEVSHVL